MKAMLKVTITSVPLLLKLDGRRLLFTAHAEGNFSIMSFHIDKIILASSFRTLDARPSSLKPSAFVSLIIWRRTSSSS